MRGAVPSPRTNSRTGTSGKEQIGKKSAIARSWLAAGDLGFGAQQKLQRQLILLETQQETAGLLPDAALRIPGEQGAKFKSRLFDGTLRQKQAGETPRVPGPAGWQSHG